MQYNDLISKWWNIFHKIDKSLKRHPMIQHQHQRPSADQGWWIQPLCALITASYAHHRRINAFTINRNIVIIAISNMAFISIIIIITNITKISFISLPSSSSHSTFVILLDAYFFVAVVFFQCCINCLFDWQALNTACQFYHFTVHTSTNHADHSNHANRDFTLHNVLWYRTAENYKARALRALGLLLADGTPTVGGG